MKIRSSIENDLLIKYTVIAVLGFIIYFNVLHGEFVCDDYGTIVDNPSIIRLNPGEIFKNFNTRFIAGLSFAFNYWLGHQDTFGYHFFNIIVHIINAILIYHFVSKTFQTSGLKDSPLRQHSSQIAFYAALIFLSHPMQTQGVSYISQRLASMGTMFYLGAFLLYLKARLERRLIFYYGALFLMIMGLLTKEMAFTLPINLVVYELLFLGASWKTDGKRLLRLFCGGIFLIAVPLFVARMRVSGDLMTAGTSTADFFEWTYFFAELNVLRLYLKDFIFPWPQSHSYDYPMGPGWGGAATILSVVLLVSLVVYALGNIQKNRLAGYAVFWFFITTSMEAGFAVCYAGRGAGLMYDHWLYLPMAGFSLFFVSEVYRRCRSVRIIQYFLWAVVIICCVASHERNKVWQTEVGLWEDVLQKNPKSLVHYLALGVSYERKERWREAVAVYQQGISMYERHELTGASPGIQRVYLSRIYNNLGIIAADREHDNAQAMEYFRRAAEIDNNNADAYNNLRILAGGSADR